MALGGSPDQIRNEARRVRAATEDLDGPRSRLRSGHGVQWVGVAGDRFRERLAEHATAVGRRQEDALEVAAALERLADALEERQAAIRRAQELVEDAVDGARRLLDRIGDHAEDVLTATDKAARTAARSVLGTAASRPQAGAPEWLELARKVGR